MSRPGVGLVSKLSIGAVSQPGIESVSQPCVGLLSLSGSEFVSQPGIGWYRCQEPCLYIGGVAGWYHDRISG